MSWSEISILPEPSIPNRIGSFEEFMKIKDELFVNFGLPEHVFNPNVGYSEAGFRQDVNFSSLAGCGTPPAAINPRVVLNLDLGPSENVTIPFTSKYNKKTPREKHDWTKEGF